MKRFRFEAPRKLEAFCERQFGTEALEQIHICSNGIGGPVPIMGLEASAYRGTIIPRKVDRDIALSMIRRQEKWRRIKGERGGFASLSDLISEATGGGKRQQLRYEKTSTVTGGATTASQSLWNVGAQPGAGANAAAAPGGTSYTNSTTGGLAQSNPAGSDTLHLTTWSGLSTVTGGLLLYDRIIAWSVSEATASNAITGTQTRYNGAAGSLSYPGSAFVTSRVTTVRAANADTVAFTYKNQDNAAAAANTAVAMVSAAAVGRVVFTPPQWAFTLIAGDWGVREVTNFTYSATSTGVIEFEHGYPLAILPAMTANVGFVLDGINSCFNLVQIQSSACLSLFEFYKTGTAVQTYSGMVTLVSG